RLGTDLEWRMGRASVKGEWTRTAFRGVTKGVLREDAIFDAWYISAGFFLTGEKKPRGQAVKPRKRWGALEVALRYEEFWGRQALLDKGFATGTDRVRAIGSGLNWTPNKHIRLGLNHIHPFFGDPVSMGGKKLNGEDVFLFRTQFEF
ncbi:MAG: hypothetical protein HY402_04395, partial [Elusimicrobia bacterium]|nr:hypothetical protein [Elusimicrobiota bacterium]